MFETRQLVAGPVYSQPSNWLKLCIATGVGRGHRCAPRAATHVASEAGPEARGP